MQTLNPETQDEPVAAKPEGKGRNHMRLAIFVLGGALIGYLYYRFVGCRSGVCPITSNPYISAGYGALMGLMLGRS